MINSQKLKKLAKIMVNYSISVQKEEKILLRGYGFDSYPLIKELYRESIKAGAIQVDVRFSTDELTRIFFDNATKAQLEYKGPLDEKNAQEYDAMIQIIANENPYELTHVPIKKLNIRQKILKPISDILHKRKWCLFYYPNAATAFKAQKNLEEWQEFVLDSAIQDYKKEELKQVKFIKVLKKVKEIHITGEETDLKVRVDNQNWRECCGKYNIPDGEVFTSPLRTKVDGVIKYNVPTHYRGKDFEWIKLTFKNGKIIKEQASNNLKALSEILDTDKGSRHVGEIAFGLNDNITEATRLIIFDEKMGKSMHMAMGKCYDECPNGNDSHIHWDMIFNFRWAKAEIFFDGKKVFSKDKWVDKQLVFLNS